MTRSSLKPSWKILRNVCRFNNGLINTRAIIRFHQFADQERLCCKSGLTWFFLIAIVLVVHPSYSTLSDSDRRNSVQLQSHDLSFRQQRNCSSALKLLLDEMRRGSTSGVKLIWLRAIIRVVGTLGISTILH